MCVTDVYCFFTSGRGHTRWQRDFCFYVQKTDFELATWLEFRRVSFGAVVVVVVVVVDSPHFFFFPLLLPGHKS